MKDRYTDEPGKRAREGRRGRTTLGTARPFTLLQKPMRQLILGSSAVVLVFLFYGIFLSHTIDITMADLGRHIKNGEFLFQSCNVLSTNYYSYTNPDFPVENHHWGAGVLFYAAWRLAGFTGVHLFFVLLSLSTFGIFYAIAVQRAGIGVASLVSLVLVPVLALRMEVRPEVFTGLLAGLFLLFLLRFREGKIAYKRLLVILPFLEICWVNLHIYFPLGPALIAAFWIESIINSRERFWNWSLLLIFTSLAALVNPFGIEGALAPFTIFENYGYQIIENQPLWLTEPLNRVSLAIYFKVASLLLVVSIVAAAVKRPKEPMWSFIFLGIFAASAGWLAVRNFALSGLFAIPVISANISLLQGENREAQEPILKLLATVLLAAVIVLSVTGTLNNAFPQLAREAGIGLASNNSAAADFMKRAHVRGPIFNNFEVGGYLIYYLFPQESVFVDNRPEAYPADFFNKTYIPMQMNSAYWKILSNTFYGFNTIVFARGDATPWGQRFLADRLQDNEWMNVYADPAVIIFVRR